MSAPERLTFADRRQGHEAFRAQVRAFPNGQRIYLGAFRSLDAADAVARAARARFHITTNGHATEEAHAVPPA